LCEPGALIDTLATEKEPFLMRQRDAVTMGPDRSIADARILPGDPLIDADMK